MDICVDGEPIMTISETKKKVMQYHINKEIFENDVKRRLQWILTHKYQQSFQNLKADWEPKLISRYSSIPTDPDALAELIFLQPDYKDKSARDLGIDPSEECSADPLLPL